MVKIQSNIEEGFQAARPVLTMGMFDGVHKGHRALLSRVVQKAKEINGESVVLTFWPHPRMVLGKDSEQLRFLTTLDEKTRLLSEAGVDHIIIMPFSITLAELSAENFIKNYLVRKIGINYLLVGYNHRFGHGGISPAQLENLAGLYKFDFEYYGPATVNGIKPSSTSIRKFISDGDVYEGALLLGRFYGVKGIIVGGKRLGRQIGYPTANIEPDDSRKLIPQDGVYACKVHLLGKSFGGMINIGKRPTIENEHADKSLEVHIFDFHREVYSEEITVEFIKRTRPEIKFPNIETLKKRLREDEIETREILKREGIL